MQKVFWDNPYLSTLTTTVTAVNGNEVLLNSTIAYSFSGGQESDVCLINGMSVLNSRMADHCIYYLLPDHHGLKEGDVVQMDIDWTRRYRLMRLHFAAELILEIVTQLFALEKIGAHIAEHKSRIDFICSENISNYFPAILEKYNHIIENDQRIQTGFTDIENQKRYWKIDGFAKVPCGGTHVRSTSEVGFVTLKRIRLGNAKERIEIKLIHD